MPDVESAMVSHVAHANVKQLLGLTTIFAEDMCFLFDNTQACTCSKSGWKKARICIAICFLHGPGGGPVPDSPHHPGRLE